jgi:hypothetical protein
MLGEIVEVGMDILTRKIGQALLNNMWFRLFILCDTAQTLLFVRHAMKISGNYRAMEAITPSICRILTPLPIVVELLLPKCAIERTVDEILVGFSGEHGSKVGACKSVH